jgi:hypothetical protein
MDIIAPIIQQPYNVTAVVPTKAADGALQHNLLPQQVVQATVVSTTAEQVVLDFGKHTITANTANSQQPLAAGQKLNLQVVATEPQLQFQVVDGKGDPSLLRLLHLFDHRSELGSQLSKLLMQRPSPPGSANTSPALTAPPTTQGPQPAQAQNVTASNQLTAKPVAGQGNPPTAQSIPLSSATVGGAVVASVSSPLNTLAAVGLTPLQRQTLEGALVPQQWAQLEQLSTQMASAMSSSNSKFVVNLARMLGLDFEALLAKDRLDPANPGLKGTLAALTSRGEVAESVRDTAAQMSQQLEVLQLCRLRLAQEGVLFLPLPLEFVEQGYVLFEQQGKDDSEADGADGHLVSLNLTLRQLGSMQVNLLFEQQALFVRIKCQDEATVELVEEYCDELHESLQPFSLRSIQVTTGAQDPALTLLERLQSQAGQQPPLFDARV